LATDLGSLRFDTCCERGFDRQTRHRIYVGCILNSEQSQSRWYGSVAKVVSA
jgi:hypothetical protein